MGTPQHYVIIPTLKSVQSVKSVGEQILFYLGFCSIIKVYVLLGSFSAQISPSLFVSFYAK